MFAGQNELLKTIADCQQALRETLDELRKTCASQARRIAILQESALRYRFLARVALDMEGWSTEDMEAELRSRRRRLDALLAGGGAPGAEIVVPGGGAPDYTAFSMFGSESIAEEREYVGALERLLLERQRRGGPPLLPAGVHGEPPPVAHRKEATRRPPPGESSPGRAGQ
jgi:hypothetical protein